MKIVCFFLFSIWIWSSLEPAHADEVYRCNQFLQSVTIKMDAQIPKGRQAVILQTLQEIGDVVGELRLPEHIHFSLNPMADHIGVAHIDTGVIELPSIAMNISRKALQALIAHEVTHLIVAENMKGLGKLSKETIAALSVKLIKDPEQRFFEIAPHMPYAELFCDVMAILVTGEPQAMSRLIAELLTKASPKLQKQINDEFGHTLDRRDFSVAVDDPRWKDYRPKNVVYGRFNQIRSYLWAKKMKDLPQDQRSSFFANLINIVQPLYANSRNAEAAYALLPLYEVNEQVISYLDSVSL